MNKKDIGKYLGIEFIKNENQKEIKGRKFNLKRICEEIGIGYLE